MAQDHVVMAFRKRLKKRGYTDVSIFRDPDDCSLYLISAVEPLSGERVHTVRSVVFMSYSFR